MKKRFVRVLLYIALFASLVSCAQNNEHQIAPDDFDFSLTYGVGGRNGINTYDGTITKDLVLDGFERIDFVMPREDKQRVYEAIFQYGIDQMPNNLSLNRGYVTPKNRLYFKYTCNKIVKTVLWDGASGLEDPSYPEQNNQFLRFVKFIREYIYETDEYKSMPPSNGGYH